MDQIKQHKNNDFIDITAIVHNYVKHWYLFAIAIICCISVAFIYIKVKKNIYQINANLLIKQDNNQSGGIQSALTKNFSFSNLMGGGGDVNDEVHVVSAHSTLRETVKQLNLNHTYIFEKNFLQKYDLYKKSPIEIVTETNIEDTLSTYLRFKVKIDKNENIQISAYNGNKKLGKIESTQFPISLSTSYGTFKFNKTQYYIPPKKKYTENIYICGYDDAADEVAKKTDIYIVDKKSNLIYLGVKDYNISRGKDLLNTIIKIYNEKGIIEKNLEAQNSSKFVEERISLIYKELEESEKQIEAYKKEHNLTDVGIEVKTILEQNGNFKEKQIQTETQYQIISLIADFLNNTENKYSLIPFNAGISDKASSEIIQQYNVLLLKRLKLLRSAKENSSTIITLNQQIDATRENVISTIKTMLTSAKITLKDLREQENIMLSRIKGFPTQEREFFNIKRDQIIKQELYLFLLQKKEENALKLAITTPKGQIIDSAYNLSKPLGIPKISILFIGLLCGIILPIAYIHLKDIFRTKFRNKAELELLTNIPIIGEICTNNSDNNIVIKEGINNPISELFRLIRSNIQFILTNKEEKVILITSSIAGEGKSFFSSNFAVSLSLLNKKVLLIGSDIRNPKLGEYLCIDNPTGLTNYLATDNLSSKDIIIPNAIQENMDVILAGPIPPNPSELLQNSRLEILFKELRSKYDYIIVDSAPIGMVSDTYTLMQYTDSILYVCRANYTNKESIRYLNEQIANGRLKNVSLIINGTDTTSGYGYGYGQKK